ncbi:MAG: SAM-dependent methyltransferase, partial [Acidobacteriota bacterium]
MSDDPRPPGSRSPILNVQELLATGLSSDAASAPPVPPTPVPDMPAPMRNRLTPPPALPPVPGVATEGRRRTARASNEEAAAGRSSAGSSPADGDDGRPYRSIEDPVRFSRSHLWALQRAYFERTGVDAWRKNVVPHYVTSNPFIAQAYAQQIIGFLRDLQARGLAGDNPVYILELGGGSGRFTFQVLYALYDRMMRSSLRHVKLRYVFTDFAEKNLAFIANHPQLRPFFESGLLDVAAFDTVRDSRIHLRLNDEILGPSSLRNPLIVLANYVFDSLPHDIFRIRNRAIHEVLIGLDAPADVDEGDPALLPHVRLRNEDVPFEGAYYHDEALDGVLEDYRQGLDDVFITLPIGGFDCISRLADLHEHRQLMLICADKGIHQPADFDIELPPVGRHGSISMQVNLDALGRVIARRGG